MTKIADLVSLGYLGMRDETPLQLTDARTAIFGVRIKDIDRTDITYKLDDFGDVQGAVFYGAKSRRVGSWMMAAPALWADGQTQPIGNSVFEADKRYKAEDTESFGGEAYPAGTPGIVIASTNEGEEEKLFFPSFSGLVAHHEGKGPPQYSSMVYDINPKGELDEDRKAGLHSAFWVKLIEKDSGAIAWNLTKSKGDATGYGLYTSMPGDLPTGTVLRGANQAILAYASHEMNGPFHPGSVQDKHIIRATPDGPLNSGHLDTNAYFYMNRAKDAPLNFEPFNHPQTKEGMFPYAVHLRYAAGAQHPHVTGMKQGKWMWHVKIPEAYIPPKWPPDWPIGPPDLTGGPDGGKNPPVPPTGGPGGGKIPKAPEGYSPPDSGGKAKWVPGLPGWDPRWGPAPTQPKPVTDYAKMLEGESSKELQKALKEISDASKAIGKKPFGLVMSPGKKMMPGFALQGQPARTNEKFAKFVDPASGNDVIDKIIKKMSDDWPAVAQIEGYAKETTPGILDKTSNPVDRYRTGTAPGGIAIFPPEVGMDDYDYSYAPPGTTISDTYITLLNDKVHLAWGHPDPILGRPISGFKIANESSQYLSLRQFDSAGASIQSGFLDIYHNASIRGSTAPGLDIVNTTAAADTNSGFLRFSGYAGGADGDMRIRQESISSVSALAIHDVTQRIAYFQAGTGNFNLGGGSAGNIDLSGATTGKAIVKALQVTTSPTSGYVLKSDASGNATWQADTVGTGDVVGPGSATDHALARFDTTTGKLLQDSVGILTDAGVLSGLTGLATSAFQLTTGAAANALMGSDASGNASWISSLTGLTGLATSAFQLTTAPSAGYVLQSDASGNASWAAGAGSSTGWTKTGTDVHLTTATDLVKIGSTIPSGKLSVVGTADEPTFYISPFATQVNDIMQIWGQSSLEALFINGDGQVLLGSSTDVSSAFTRLQLASATATDLTLVSASNTSTHKPNIYGYKARGSLASPAVVVAGDELFNLSAVAYDGSAWTVVGGIEIGVGSVTGAGVPYTVTSGMDFYTGNHVRRLSIDENGLFDYQGNSLTNVLDIDGGTGNLNLTANATGKVTVNSAAEDVDFLVSGDTDADLFVVNAGADRVGVGINNPTNAKFHVFGATNQRQIRVTGASGQTTPLFEVEKYGGTVQLLDLYESEAVFNEAGADIDFRVESDNEANAFFVDGANGIVTMAAQSNCRAYRNSSVQSIPNITFTKVQLNATDYDIRSEFDTATNYRFTATDAGIYHITGSCFFSGDPSFMAVSIYLNGSEIARNAIPGGVGFLGLGVSTHYQISAGQYIEMFVYQASGGNLDLNFSSPLTFLSVSKVA